MADFTEAFNLTMGHEGGYVNDPDDRGAETYRGISRRFNPSWQGWVVIDNAKVLPNFPYLLDDDVHLDGMVRNHYQSHYWDRFQGDRILHQPLANELFDNAVNMGVHKSVSFLQSALNLLNRNQSLYDDILEDGLCGTGTLNALNLYHQKDDDMALLIKVINIQQGNFYLEIMRKNKTQEKYLRGWLKRVVC